jgi:carbamoyl-phosphate synthase small subunit
MTDPSYRGQILVFTTPMIGNYGVPQNSAPIDGQDVGVILESKGIQCSAVVVADLAERFSHHAAVESLHSWCERHGVPGITGVDTRAITRILRDRGTTLGHLAVGNDVELPPPADHEFWDPTSENLVDQVSVREPYTLNPSGDVRIAVLDFGAKANILRSLVRRGVSCTVLPWNHDFNAIRDTLLRGRYEIEEDVCRMGQADFWDLYGPSSHRYGSWARGLQDDLWKQRS